jgi:amino acid permease
VRRRTPGKQAQGTSDDPQGDGEDKSKGLGGKTISSFGSFALLFNNITGPGMVSLPLMYQASGWLLPSLWILIVFIISSFSSTLLCKAITRVPGNEHFEGRVEMTNLARMLMPRMWFLAVIVGFVLVLSVSNVVAIIESAQTTDDTLIAIFGSTCGLCFSKDNNGTIEPSVHFRCAHRNTPGDSPFGNNVYVLSFGYMIVAVLCIPLGYYNLDDNISVQIAAFWLLLIVFFLWILNFVGNISSGNSFPVKAIGHTQSGVVGTVLLNYAFVVTVPSWVNEKRPDVDVNRSIWWSNVAGTTTFILIGWLGARAFNYGPAGNQEDMTAKLGEAGAHVWVATRVATYLFPWAALVSGIPVMSITIRYQVSERLQVQQSTPIHTTTDCRLTLSALGA